MHKVKTLFFETTPHCSLNCRHCYNIQRISDTYPKNLLNTQDTVDVLKTAIKKMKCQSLVLTGGEFYMRPDAEDIIVAAKKSGIKNISIMTNGSFLDADKISFAKSNGVRFFEISFISGDRSVFDAESRCKGFSAFDNAVYATQECVKQGVLVSHIFVATKKNIHTLSDTLKLSYALGVRNFSFNRFNPCGNGRDYVDELQLSPVELLKGLKICDDFVKEHADMCIYSPINIPPCIIDTKELKYIRVALCVVSANQEILVMDYLGNIRLCSFSPTIVGNIKTMSIDEIFKTEVAQKFIQAHPDFCSPCKHLKRCQGGCKASSDNCFGDATRENPFLEKYKIKPIV